jgi:5,10-methenyltetrahydromethanopterin hydrogenase
MVTVPAGLAARVPENVEPSDIDMAAAVTVVPAAALSGRDAAFGVKATLVGTALTWTWMALEAVRPFWVALTPH